MRSIFVVFMLACTVPAVAADVQVFGIRHSAMKGGGFRPAGTDLICTAMDGGRCYTGGQWRQLIPAGPRRYETVLPERVACMAIADADCLSVDRKWYRIPRGQLAGVTGGLFGPTPGAFVTAPLR